MNKSERAAKAFDFAQEVVKQEITLATAIFALTLTFLQDVVPAGTDSTLLNFSWGFYIGSVFFGLMTLMALAGVLGSDDSEDSDVYGSGIRLFAGLQSVMFFIALGLTFLFGLKVV
jgi:hypothetical protein